MFHLWYNRRSVTIRRETILIWQQFKSVSPFQDILICNVLVNYPVTESWEKLTQWQNCGWSFNQDLHKCINLNKMLFSLPFSVSYMGNKTVNKLWHFRVKALPDAYSRARGPLRAHPERVIYEDENTGQVKHIVSHLWYNWRSVTIRRETILIWQQFKSVSPFQDILICNVLVGLGC